MNLEDFEPNDRLRRARSLKGWTQAELAEHVGTSFEMVSRWERGITVPSHYYRERMCAALGQNAEELGLVRDRNEPFTRSPSSLVFLASSHVDAEKTIVSHLKSALLDRGITLWSSRQLGRQETNNSRAALREVVRTAQVILVIISPETRSSRHVREALEMARMYQRPVCGVWIEGEHWQECLPNGSIELTAPIDSRGRDDAVLFEEITRALERVGLDSRDTGIAPPGEPGVVDNPLPTILPLPTTLTSHGHRRSLSRITVGLLIGLIVLVIAGGILGSLSLLTHFGVIGPRIDATTPVRGGTWFDDIFADPTSLIPNGDFNFTLSGLVDQALYLPLFYGDAQGLFHPGAATKVPTLQNGGISADAKTWTFQLRPHLVWSDGQPYDARDVDYTWKLWLNHKFGTPNTTTTGYDLITSAEVSADHLSITFHLKQAYAPFLSLWVDGVWAPLPAHHFSRVAPEAIINSPDNLNPRVTSGPFTMEESVPGDHYTLARNPRYYRFNEGLPFLDRVVFRIVADEDAILKDLQVGSIDSAGFLDVSKRQEYQRLKNYTLATSPTSNTFEAMYFNFHNTVLASHLEVRAAMVMAIDQQALIDGARYGFATGLCTDHGSALHPGYDTRVYCPQFNLAAANKLLEDNGWAKGTDGVRVKGGQRLEFEYSTTTERPWRVAGEAIIQHNFMAIGIKLDIQNYIHDTFFGPFLNGGKASPPTGAVAGRYDIAEWANSFGYDPDDSFVLACDQFPPNGINWTFYCNHALDALYRQEQATVDAGVRQQIFYQIHQIYLTTLPFITLYSPIESAIVRKGTHNYQPSPIEGETVNIWEWWCDKGKC